MRKLNQLEITMTTSLRKGQPKRSNVMKKIKVGGEVDKGQEVIVRYEETVTLKWKGFESHMVIWTKIYERI
jgi:hypothetical protein